MISPNDRMLCILQLTLERHLGMSLPELAARKLLGEMNEIRYEADAYALATKTEREVLDLYYNAQRRLGP